MQEYTTKFHHDLFLTLLEMTMKYTKGLVDYIWKELKLFTLKIIKDSTMKGISFKAKNKWPDKRYDKQPTRNQIVKVKGSRVRKATHRPMLHYELKSKN